MTHTPNPDTTPQSQAAVSAAEPGTARPRLRDQIVENPLLSLFGVALTLLGTALVALLIFTLTSISGRIDGVEASLGERIDGVEASLGERIDGVEMRLGARIDRVEMRLGERIDRVEMRLGARIDRVGARVDRLEAKVDAGFGATQPEREPPG